MSNNVIQTSFAGGELSPTLYARVDLAKYHVGAAKLLNFFVDYRGGVTSRPGLELVCRCKDSSLPVRVIPFQFNTVQTYALEFGDFYMRVVKDGAQVLETAKVIVAATNANPGVFNVVAHGYVNGDQVALTATGMTEVNGKDFFVAVVNANNFQLQRWDGSFVNTTSYGVFVAGTVARVYTVVSPYAAADLVLLKFTQSADTMTICHPDYAPQDLTRTGDTSWTFTPVAFGTTAVAPAGAVTVTVVPATVGTTEYAYIVTSVNAVGDESVASATGDTTLKIDIAATAGSVLISWTAVAGAVSYNVYKALPCTGNSIPAGVLFGYMTTVQAPSVTAVDTNIVPDFTVSSPRNTNPFSGNNPIAVTYDQQRKVYAGSNLYPETFWMSKPGQFNNFSTSVPVQPSDAITATLVSRQVNNIKYMVSMPGGLIMLTGGGAWQVSGGSAGAVLSPTTVTATPQAYNGCADVEPLTINYDILYVQQKGTVVRDLSYSFYTNIYTGADLSVLSNHLFTGYSIVEWTYAEEPYKIIWAVRSDGALLSLTYLKEQEVFGWARHETQGRFKSIVSIQEGQENAVYVVVQRLIGGELVSFIERMHTRLMPYGPEDAFFVDCGLSTVPRYPDATLNISATSGTGVTYSTDLPAFTAANIGDVIRAGYGIATVTGFTDVQTVTCTIAQDVTDVDTFRSPEAVWPQASGSWSIATPTAVVSGLDHLEGETVAILGDGNVFPTQVVTSGTVTLSQPCANIHVGLGYTAQLQTLYLDVGEGAMTAQGKRKNIVAMTARVDQTRGLAMGQTFEDLTDFKDRDLDTIGEPIELFTGDQRMLIGGGWNTEAQVCLQQSNPLPATVLGVIPEVQLGDSGK